MTPLDQLRLRLPDHDFDRLMQAAKPVADRKAFLKDIAAELGQHEAVGPGLLHRIMSEVQRRYDVVDQRRTRRCEGGQPRARGAMTEVLGDGQPILRH